MIVPPELAMPGPVLVTARSAEVATVVVTVDMLLAGLGSVVLLVIEAMFVIVEPPGALLMRVTTRTNLSVLPPHTIPPVGVPVTRAADCVYVKPSGFIPLTAVADTKVVPVGTISVSDTPAALF